MFVDKHRNYIKGVLRPILALPLSRMPNRPVCICPSVVHLLKSEEEDFFRSLYVFPRGEGFNTVGCPKPNCSKNYQHI